MAELQFVVKHNQAVALSNAPADKQIYQSMINGLKRSHLSYALQENPDMCKVCVTDFWENAVHDKLRKDGEAIQSKVRGTPVIVTEQTIREVLKFEDQPSFPTEYPTKKIVPVLKRMGYEGTYPSTKKKFLPPFWRFLFHLYNNCLSGKKGGSDEITIAGTSALVALTLDWEFNYSKVVSEPPKRINHQEQLRRFEPVLQKFIRKLEFSGKATFCSAKATFFWAKATFSACFDFFFEAFHRTPWVQST